MRRLELRIHGRVQGVSFRFYAQAQARRLGLGGWVRNLPAGAVELVAEGEERDLQKLLSWCQEGPHGARVDRVDVKWSAAQGEEESGEFEIRH